MTAEKKSTDCTALIVPHDESVDDWIKWDVKVPRSHALPNVSFGRGKSLNFRRLGFAWTLLAVKHAPGLVVMQSLHRSNCEFPFPQLGGFAPS